MFQLFIWIVLLLLLFNYSDKWVGKNILIITVAANELCLVFTVLLSLDLMNAPRENNSIAEWMFYDIMSPIYICGDLGSVQLSGWIIVRGKVLRKSEVQWSKENKFSCVRSFNNGILYKKNESLVFHLLELESKEKFWSFMYFFIK